MYSAMTGSATVVNKKLDVRLQQVRTRLCAVPPLCELILNRVLGGGLEV